MSMIVWACSKETLNFTQSPEKQTQRLKEDLNDLAIELRNNNKTFEDSTYVMKIQKELLEKKYGKEVYNNAIIELQNQQTISRSRNGVSSMELKSFVNELDIIYDNNENYDTMLLEIENLKIRINSSTLIKDEKQALNTFIQNNATFIEFVKMNPDLFGIDLNNVSRAISSGWWNDWGRCAFMIATSVVVTASAVTIAAGTAGAGATLAFWLVSKTAATVGIIDGC